MFEGRGRATICSIGVRTKFLHSTFSRLVAILAVCNTVVPYFSPKLSLEYRMGKAHRVDGVAVVSFTAYDDVYRMVRCGRSGQSPMCLRQNPILALVFAAAACTPWTAEGAAHSNKLWFRHSWDTLPVVWFSANTTGPESDAEMALIANYSAAILVRSVET